MPLAVALILTAALMLVGHLVLRHACGGTVCFPLDDAWIHLAIAEHAVSGTWGLVPGVDGSSTSSPLWTALLVPLVPLREAGAHLLGAASGLLLVSVAATCLPRERRLVGLLALVLLVPVPALALLGMEHLLHAALVLALFRWRDHRYAWLFAALLPMIRLEGFFAVAAAALWVDRRQALRLVLASALPAGAYALWSLSLGWFALPTAVVLKSALDHPVVVVNLRAAPGVVLLLGGLLLLARRSPWAAAAVFCGVLQLVLARFGWLARYEAWLVALAVVAWVRAAPRRWMLLLLLVLVPRAWHASSALPERAALTWRQHVHLGHFLAQLPPGTVVATTEAGAATYLSDIVLLDLAGLGHVEIARALRAGGSPHPVVAAAEPRLAAVFGWYDGPPMGPGLPEGWTLLGRWSDPGISDAQALGFWVPGEDPEVRARLEAFAAALPEGVEWRPATE